MILLFAALQPCCGLGVRRHSHDEASEAGHRLVPTEIGSEVGADGWKESLECQFLSEWVHDR